MLMTVALGFSTILGVYLLLCLALRQWQARLTFLPSRWIKFTPDQYHMPYEEVWIPVDRDGQTQLNGWWIPVQGATQAVLLLHGNGFNIGANLPQAQVFYRLGYSVLLIDYQGYGKSTGRFPTETQVYGDAQVGLDYLRSQRGFSPEHIIVFGHSLGGAIAIHLASQNPRLAALIIQGSFTNIRDMAEYDGFAAVLPIDWILRQSFDSMALLPSLQMPIFFVHGERDRRVPAWMSQALYDRATTEHKDLYFLPEGDHNHVPEIGGQAYQDAIAQFLATISHTAPATAPS